MSSIITTIGWVGFAAGLIYFVIQDRSGASSYGYVSTTQQIFIVSAVLVVVGYVLKYLGRILGLSASRCRTCGKRIPKQEMYCFDHRLEAIRKAQDHGRITGPKKH